MDLRTFVRIDIYHTPLVFRLVNVGAREILGLMVELGGVKQDKLGKTSKVLRSLATGYFFRSWIVGRWPAGLGKNS
jgi:hypothetical protein